MNKTNALSSSKTAILTLSEIKAALGGFESGETNVFEALDAIVSAVEAYRASATPRHDAA